MALSEDKLRVCVQRLLLSRMRILCNHGFFGLLLMHMRYAVDEVTPTAYTDGERIVFGVEFLEGLSDTELDFVMMHEIMHVALRHCFRGVELDDELFNVACDIVVNSNLLLECGMRKSAITLSEHGEAMHLTPDGQEGYDFTAEEVYAMLLEEASQAKSALLDGQWDDHSEWQGELTPAAVRDAWEKRVRDAAEAMEVRDPSNAHGQLPLFASRLLGKLRSAQTDWRRELCDFVQEEITDYSFTPPDRRFDGGDFFLPDFNEREERARDVLFMIDTSGSVSDSMLSAAYSEIHGALEQFNGKLSGWLGFFDAAVIPPVPFASREELEKIRPAGGGGTDFEVVFDYVREQMEETPASIVILTDGQAPFPEESAAMGIPVLWLLTEEGVTPPWGRVAHVKL